MSSIRGQIADLLEHLNQAKHNQQWAGMILTSNPTFRDWAITSAFYAALHFAEACFTTRNDIQRPKTMDPHTFRSETIKKEANRALHDYRKLREACWSVRYLENGRWQERYKIDVAESLVNESLPKVRQELESAFEVSLK